MSKKLWEVVEGNYIKQKIYAELKNKYQLELVELYISRECPLACFHCFQGGVSSIDEPLSIDEWRKVIEGFLGVGVRHFHLAGKEPFLSKDVEPILELLSEIKNGCKEVIYGVITNGLSFLPHLSTLSESMIDYVEFSVDGTREIHNQIRGKVVYDLIKRNMSQALVQVGSNRISTATAVCNSNLNCIIDLIEELGGLGVKRFFLQPVQLIGKAVDSEFEIVSAENYRSLIYKLIAFIHSSKNRNNHIQIMIYVPPEMVYEVCFGERYFEKILEDQVFNGNFVERTGTNSIQIKFDLIKVPYWKKVIVTDDGYLLDDCSTCADQNYFENSVGSIRKGELRTLINKAHEIALNSVDV